MGYAINNEEGIVAQARFSASRAEQLMACPGSANLSLSIPGWVPPVIDEEKGRKGVGHTYHEYLRFVAELKAREMKALAAAIAYVADLRSRRRFKVLAEDTVECDWLVSKPKTTVDLVLHVSDELHIIDWKTGVIPVFAYQNPQLKFYAINYVHLAPKAKEVHLHIVQPWAEVNGLPHLDEYVVSGTDLLQYKLDLQAGEAAVLAGSTKLVPGEHCKFCPAFPHSRSDKGSPLCPPAMRLLYPMNEDTDEILALA